MNKKYIIALSVFALAPLMAGCETSPQPAAPSTSNPNSPPADGSTLKIDAPPLVSPVNGTTLADTTAVLVVTNVNGKNASFPVTYEFEVRDAAGALVANPKVPASAGSTTSLTVPNQLQGNVTYSWRARATYNGGLGPWATTTTFRTQLASFIQGQRVVDLLTTGTTVGKRLGGQFVAGGWQSLSLNDGIDYDLSAPLDTGTVEFDITNIGQQEGEAFKKDLKFLSMGDASAFGDFGSFRDHPWKMHLVQRADNDGLEIVWRDGTSSGADWNDHRIKETCCGPKFTNSNVTHFVVQWDPFGYRVYAGTNGATPELYLVAPGEADGFNQEYRPPHHRISLGCYPRSESFVGAIYRNVRITPK